MRPFTVLIGILMGSSASIAFGLGVVILVFLILAGKHPELAHELPRLAVSFVAFSIMTAASAGSFIGQIKSRRWRGWAHLGTLACLAVVALLYWPRGA